MENLSYREITRIIVDTAFKLHQRLGPGLLESVYQTILTHELRKQGLQIQAEVPIQVRWDEVNIEVGFRADLIVEDRVILELKSVEVLAPVHKKTTFNLFEIVG